MRFLTFLTLLAIICMAAAGCKKRQCERACTLEYRPVCAITLKDGFITFGNKCAFDVYNCETWGAATLLGEGACEKYLKHVMH